MYILFRPLTAFTCVTLGAVTAELDEREEKGDGRKQAGDKFPRPELDWLGVVRSLTHSQAPVGRLLHLGPKTRERERTVMPESFNSYGSKV